MKIRNIWNLLFVFAIFYCNLSSQIRINEICASNSKSLYDEEYDTPDWIELYNYSNEPVNLKDYRISDKNDFENAWQFPDTVIQPKRYLIVFASKKDRVKENIKISSNGINTNEFEDTLSMAYIRLIGDNELIVEYNSFDFEIDTLNFNARAGLILKDKLNSNSRMVSSLVSQSNYNSVYIQNRRKQDTIKEKKLLISRLDLQKFKFTIRKKSDSVITEVLDKTNYPVFRESFYFPNMEEYYIGFTVLSNMIGQHLDLNIKSIKLNNRIVDYNELKKISFFDTEINVKFDRFIHSDFALSKKSDSLFLWNSKLLIESLNFSDLDFDESIGYVNGLYEYTHETSPNRPNNKGFSLKSKLDLEEKSMFFNNNLVLSNIEKDVFYDSEFSKPFKFINSAKGELFSSTNLIALQKLESNSEPSTIKYLPIVKQEDILSDVLHIFINADSNELFNKKYGAIGADFSEKKVDSYCSIFKGNELLFKENIDITKQGSLSSVGRLQGSVRLYLKNNIEEIFGDNIFPNKIKKYGEKLNIRNAGNDIKLYIRDLYAQKIGEHLDLDWSDHSPSFVYFNNKFWGLYNIRQRIDDDFFSEKYNLDKQDINFLENDLVIKYGTNSELLEFRKEFNLLDHKQIYKKADSLFNLESMIDYLFIETYTLNHDWPYNNVHYWNAKGRKWNFVLNDLDFSFRFHGAAPTVNNLDLIFSDEKFFIIELFNILIKNQDFKYSFFNRVCDLINTDFSVDVLTSKLDEIKKEYEPLVGFQHKRWPETVINWDEEIDIMYHFVYYRPRYYLRYSNEELGDPGIANLNLTTYPPNSGTFKVNTITIDTSKWEGRYFQTLPVTITAIPKHGKKFIRWNHDSLGTNPKITTTLPETITLEAIYKEIDISEEEESIVINEIMYNADKDTDTKDWVELYNAGTKEVNLKGWSLIDEDTTHEIFIIEEDYLIQPDEYVIFTKERTEFEKIISIDNKVFGDFTFGFGGNDIVLLKDSDGNTQDSVNYDNDEPWPINADGTGFTIELKNPKLDNNEAINWEASQPLLGTPGRENSNFELLISNIKIISLNSSSKIKFINNVLEIEADTTIYNLELFDIYGKKHFSKDFNYKFLVVDLNNLPNGIYVGRVLIGDTKETFKLIISK